MLPRHLYPFHFYNQRARYKRHVATDKWSQILDGLEQGNFPLLQMNQLFSLS